MKRLPSGAGVARVVAQGLLLPWFAFLVAGVVHFAEPLLRADPLPGSLLRAQGTLRRVDRGRCDAGRRPGLPEPLRIEIDLATDYGPRTFRLPCDRTLQASLVGRTLAVRYRHLSPLADRASDEVWEARDAGTVHQSLEASAGVAADRRRGAALGLAAWLVVLGLLTVGLLRPGWLRLGAARR